MSVILDNDRIRLEGPCRIEDAEPLSALLQEDAARVVDLSACTRMHAAVAQALLAFAPKLEGAVQTPLAQAVLAPLMSGPAMSTFRGTSGDLAAKESSLEDGGGRSLQGRS